MNKSDVVLKKQTARDLKEVVAEQALQFL